ncbi:hypothetical protein D3C86_1362650 [compost metagenome]
MKRPAWPCAQATSFSSDITSPSATRRWPTSLNHSLPVSTLTASCGRSAGSSRISRPRGHSRSITPARPGSISTAVRASSGSSSVQVYSPPGGAVSTRNGSAAKTSATWASSASRSRSVAIASPATVAISCARPAPGASRGPIGPSGVTTSRRPMPRPTGATSARRRVSGSRRRASPELSAWIWKWPASARSVVSSRAWASAGTASPSAIRRAACCCAAEKRITRRRRGPSWSTVIWRSASASSRAAGGSRSSMAGAGRSGGAMRST